MPQYTRVPIDSLSFGSSPDQGLATAKINALPGDARRGILHLTVTYNSSVWTVSGEMKVPITATQGTYSESVYGRCIVNVRQASGSSFPLTLVSDPIPLIPGAPLVVYVLFPAASFTGFNNIASNESYKAAQPYGYLELI